MRGRVVLRRYSNDSKDEIDSAMANPVLARGASTAVGGLETGRMCGHCGEELRSKTAILEKQSAIQAFLHTGHSHSPSSLIQRLTDGGGLAIPKQKSERTKKKRRNIFKLGNRVAIKKVGGIES